MGLRLVWLCVALSLAHLAAAVQPAVQPASLRAPFLAETVQESKTESLSQWAWGLLSKLWTWHSDSAAIHSSSVSSVTAINGNSSIDTVKVACENCCNDGLNKVPCFDVDACAATAANSSSAKYALVFAFTGSLHPGDTFLPYLETAKRAANTVGTGEQTDLILMIKDEDLKNLNKDSTERIKTFGVNIMPVIWDVPPDAMYHPKENWCGPSDFIKLHALGIEDYDAIAFYDNDIQFQGDISPVLKCASTGKFLTTSGGIGEALNGGFFALKPDPRLLNAARIFDKDNGFDTFSGWGACGWSPNPNYYAGGECQQGFLHSLFYKKACEPAAQALQQTGSQGLFEAHQIDRCTWNYQTSGWGCENFDCNLVRAHHKPVTASHTDPKECLKK